MKRSAAGNAKNTRPLKKPKDECRYTFDKCKSLLEEWSVALTGAFPDDTLTATRGCSKGCLLQVHTEDEKQFVAPQGREVHALHQHPSLWRLYLERLASIPFFAELNNAARETWLLRHADPKESSIGEQRGVRLEFQQLGGDFVTKLDEAQQAQLMDGQPRSSTEVEDMFPRKPGSLARKVTLVLHKTRWKRGSAFNLVSDTRQLLFDVSHGTFSMGGRHERIWELQYRPIAFFSSSEEKEDPGSLAAAFQIPPESWDLLIEHLRDMSPAFYKSLMQKLIRFQPLTVRLFHPSDTLVDARWVLVVVMKLLFDHVGVFVADIGRFVTGVEGLCKRLAVIAMEDSFVPEERHHELVSLLSAALLAQSVRAWKADPALLRHWCRFAIGLLEERRSFRWAKNAPTKPFQIQVGARPLEMCSALLDELRSFPGDLGMARDIAKHRGAQFRDPPPQPASRPTEMPLWHMLDQHCAPSIAWYFTTNTEPFPQLLRKLFDEVTGVNPRKCDVAERSRRHFFQTTHTVQKRLYRDLFGARFDRPVAAITQGPPVSVHYTLDDAVLSALCGAMELVYGGRTYLVALDSYDVGEMVVMKRPSRETDDGKIDVRTREHLIRVARQRLAAGFPVRDVPDSLRQFEGQTLQWIEGEPEPQLNGVPWSVAKNLHVELRQIRPMPLDLDNIFPTPECVECMERDAFQTFENVPLAKCPLPVLRRFLTYCPGFESSLRLHPIGRDGTGTEYAVTLEDTSVYWFLRKIARMFPAAVTPVPGHPGRFTFPVPFLFWLIRDRVVQHCERQQPEAYWEEKSGSLAFQHQKGYVLREHQRAALNELIYTHEKGRPGAYLWLPPGAGKTLIVLRFLQYLHDQGRLPRFVVYTYPREARDNLQKELTMMGLRYHHLIPPFVGLRPQVVNLVEHDTLRKCRERLVSVVGQAVFIADEAHKMLAATQRTSAALQLASLSRLCVAMSGTPIINSAIYQLIPWLKRVVPFEITPKNLFTAASAMVHQVYEHGIQVDRSQIDAVMPADVLARYLALVPPSLGGTNGKPEYRHLQEASELCYETCYGRMSTEAVERARAGRRVLLVAKDQAGIDALHAQVLALAPQMPVYRMQAGEMITLSPEAVETKQVPDYQVVIVDIRHSLGYTCTTCDTLISSVYPSNLATRIQIEGRLLRIGNRHPQVQVLTVFSGLLFRILMDHSNTASLIKALESLF